MFVPGLGNTSGFYCNSRSVRSELQIGQEFYWEEMVISSTTKMFKHLSWGKSNTGVIRSRNT